MNIITDLLSSLLNNFVEQLVRNLLKWMIIKIWNIRYKLLRRCKFSKKKKLLPRTIYFYMYISTNLKEKKQING